jgi:hypothetical protein
MEFDRLMVLPGRKVITVAVLNAVANDSDVVAASAFRHARLRSKPHPLDAELQDRRLKKKMSRSCDALVARGTVRPQRPRLESRRIAALPQVDSAKTHLAKLEPYKGLPNQYLSQRR